MWKLPYWTFSSHDNTPMAVKVHEQFSGIISTVDQVYSKSLSEKDRSVLRGDDLLFSVMVWSLDHLDQIAYLRKLIGVENYEVIYKFFEKERNSYAEQNVESVEVKLVDTVYVVAAPISRAFADLLQKITVVDFFLLLYGAFADISQSLSRYLKRNKISVNDIRIQLDNLAHNDVVIKVWLFAFLEMMSTVMKQMSLSLNDLTMMKLVKPEDISDMLDLLESNTSASANANANDISSFTEDSYESDVIDEEETDKKPKKIDKKTKKDKEKQMTVEVFGTDLTEEAKNNRLDPVIGREKEIDQVIYTLLRKTKSNPLLIWEAWVGKTAIVEWLAQKIVLGQVPDRIKDKRIIMLDIAAMVAGTKYRGDFEGRFKAAMEEASDPTNNIILFIDEIHTIIGAGGAAGTDDASQLIKPLLARWKIKLIAATTYDEYQQHIEKDAALKRRFQEIHVEEPNLEDTKTILLWLKSRFEEFHGVQITDESIDSAIAFAHRYIMNKHFPDKAIDIIDEAAARKSTFATKLDLDEDYAKMSEQITLLTKQIEKSVADQDYFTASELKQKIQKLKDKLRTLRSSKAMPMHLRPIVEKDDVGRVLADKTGVPTQVVTESEVEKLQRLKSHLEGKIFGQEEAVAAVVKTIQRSRLSVVEKNKPIASFLFLGPSGVGKTYLAKLIAKDYFGDEKAMIRVDMSEFMESYTVSKLIGSAPGYVGYESGGMLTEQVRRKPYCVILLDEIEKANRDVLNILLQILDEGQIKDNKGRLISFKSTIIVMTSNLGAEEFGKKKASIGFSSESDLDTRSTKDWDKITAKVQDHVKDFISPELQNRIDYNIIFKPLSKDLMGQILKIKLDDFLKVWTSKTGVSVPSFDDHKISSIIDKIYNPQFGARPIEKYIYDEVEPELIEQIMAQ